MNTYSRVRMVAEGSDNGEVGEVATILAQRIGERSAVPVRIQGGPALAGEMQVHLAIVPHSAEGYRIESLQQGVRITGSGQAELLAGVGRFLRDARLGEREITPGTWRGEASPDCPVRGIYCALNNNWYSWAPRAEIERYMEDLALWGINSIVTYPAMGEEPGSTPGRRDRSRLLIQAARRVGLKAGLLVSPNTGPETAPEDIRAEPFPDTDPPRRGFAGTLICPSRPEGFAYLSRLLAESLDEYRDLGLDYVVSFPYDCGGCGCRRCWPWGAGGYLTISWELARLTRERYPDCRFVLGTWCFDVREEPDGEWEGLAQALARDASWVDAVMADAHEDFPAYPLERGVPGGLPLLDFAEISMWGRFPWGGYGANPLPARLQRLWNQAKHSLSGGFPYSEGIFEDLNKVICAGFFWNKEAQAENTVREYVAWEFAPDVVEQVARAIALLERNYPRASWARDEVEEACAFLEEADRRLPERVRSSWRWRILLLRGVIDRELVAHDAEMTDRCDEAFEELIRIFHLEHGWRCVTPPSRAYLARQQAGQREGQALPPGVHQGM